MFLCLIKTVLLSSKDVHVSNKKWEFIIYKKWNTMDINKLVKEVIDCAYKVRMELAPGYLESVYKNAMLVELKLRGLKYETEKLIKVNYKGFVVGDFKADIVVEDSLILELKSVQCLQTVHSVQLVNYLVATGIDDGLLINFGSEKIEIKHKYRTYTPQFK